MNPIDRRTDEHLPEFKEQEWKDRRLFEHAASALALVEILLEENRNLKAQLALAAEKLLEREKRSFNDLAPETKICEECNNLFNVELIGVDGRCYKCRSKLIRKSTGPRKVLPLEETISDFLGTQETG